MAFGTSCHACWPAQTMRRIDNTASAAGLTAGGVGGPCSISKHGVMAPSEFFYKDLKVRNARLSAPVPGPGWADTKIIDSARNRTQQLRPSHAPALTPQMELRLEAVRPFIKSVIQPADIAGQAFDAIRNDTGYSVPAQPNIERALETRLEDVCLRRSRRLRRIRDGSRCRGLARASD